jgi:N,N'-diacetylbacillosaminyl-diphospho-undecaprenol alpha-1,3-N-acetylgalactosaminyltransferase
MIKIAFLSHVDFNLYLFRLPVMVKLVEEGWEIYAICPKGRVSERFKDFGIKHIAYDVERKSLNPFKEIKTIYNLYKVLKPLDLDILHTFTSKPNIYGTLAGRLARVPIIINLVEGLGSLYIENNFKARLVRNIMELLYSFAFRLADKVIVINPDDMNYFIDKRILPSQKAILIKGVGIDTEDFSRANVNENSVKDLRIELNIDKDQVVVLMVARLLVHKGVLEYLKSAEALKQRYNNKVEFLLVGDFDLGNPYNISNEILQDFVSRGIVKFLGWRDDIKELLALCDIFILPSYREGIPRTLLEAASMGKPIITTNTIGCKEVVEDGKNGYLVPPKDIKALEEAIERLILDSNLRKNFGNYSREKAIREYDLEKIVIRYMDLYKSLLKL